MKVPMWKVIHMGTINVRKNTWKGEKTKNRLKRGERRKVINMGTINVRGKAWKGEKTKNRLKTGERSDTYLPHVCNLSQSVKSQPRVDKTGAFIQHCGFHQL